MGLILTTPLNAVSHRFSGRLHPGSAGHRAATFPSTGTLPSVAITRSHRRPSPSALRSPGNVPAAEPMKRFRQTAYRLKARFQNSDPRSLGSVMLMSTSHIATACRSAMAAPVKNLTPKFSVHACDLIQRGSPLPRDLALDRLEDRQRDSAQ